MPQDGVWVPPEGRGTPVRTPLAGLWVTIHLADVHNGTREPVWCTNFRKLLKRNENPSKG